MIIIKLVYSGTPKDLKAKIYNRAVNYIELQQWD